jgi:hypothetical protein
MSSALWVAEAQKNREECRHFAAKRRSAAFIILGP